MNLGKHPIINFKENMKNFNINYKKLKDDLQVIISGEDILSGEESEKIITKANEAVDYLVVALELILGHDQEKWDKLLEEHPMPQWMKDRYCQCTTQDIMDYITDRFGLPRDILPETQEISFEYLNQAKYYVNNIVYILNHPQS